jgi:hypothetical protein
MPDAYKIRIDSTAGGNGDIWMRLVSFYAVQALKDDLRFEIVVPGFLQKLAEHTFGDRLMIVHGDFKSDYYFTNLGIKDLLKGIFSGRKYISPYQRAVIHDRKKKRIKDYVNILVFNLADWLGLVQVPKWKWIETYQGYLDVIGLKKIRNISYEEFQDQLHTDYPKISAKLKTNIPISVELSIPDDLKENLLVYPTGTSHQFIPVWWAKKYLPDAYFAFFIYDGDAEKFRECGLKTIYFYKEPGDIIALSHSAKWTISTDSFPSHLLQFATNRCAITITEVLKSRVISPVFEGKIVDSQVNCHPCLHLERKGHPVCAVGYKECLNWKNQTYTENIINSSNICFNSHVESV